ncbi:MAG: hypothetical protein K6F95_02430 [Selenomonas sp.]|uniref:hypothetical protein n=1 Tax=Selenomonas sp. TaxID=2053611 RepID=UPI0025ED8B01|nr:hypothetical protein [Selenomonas sp.]MCR5756748.1 hypothetical protein [Selenomonas sp.]
MKKIGWIVLSMIVFVGVWNSCEFVYDTYIAMEIPRFSVRTNILAPIVTFLILYKTKFLTIPEHCWKQS